MGLIEWLEINWGGLLIIGGVLIIIGLTILMFKRRKNHKHKWEYFDWTHLNKNDKDYLRMILRCRRCKQLAHIPVPSLNDLRRLEENGSNIN